MDAQTLTRLSDEQLFSLAAEALRARETKKAVTLLEILYQRLPQQPEVLNNLAVAYQQMGKLPEAEALLRQSLPLRPLPEALVSLGNVMKEKRQPEEALRCFVHALTLNPAHYEAGINHVTLLMEKNLFREALDALSAMTTLGHHTAEIFSQSLMCQLQLGLWNGLQAFRASLDYALTRESAPVNPFRLLCIGVQEHIRAHAERWTASRYALPAAQQFQYSCLPAAARGDGILRIGYISSDLHNHATAHLLGDMFAQHDASAFDVYVYSMGKDDGSAHARRLRTGPQHWRDVQTLSPQQIAMQIVTDGVDILVDLKGYTQHHAANVLAFRPAPIQVHYLGYPCTMGAAFIDYFIADDVTAPPGAEVEFTETIVRLPGCYQINDPKRALPTAPLRAALGLQEEGIVWAAFNATYKIQPELFALWIRLLAVVPGSVLWLQEPHAAEAKGHLQQAARVQGIAPERLIFAPYAPQQEHLDRMAAADIFLDTYPVSGHTTASDALWAGLPVVTRESGQFIGRVAASLLTAVQLPELVCRSMEEYEEKALALANDPARRAAIHAHLLEMRIKPPFDGISSLRHLEEAYRKMAKDY